MNLLLARGRLLLALGLAGLAGFFFVGVLSVLLLAVVFVLVVKACWRVLRHLLRHPSDRWSWALLVGATALWWATSASGRVLQQHGGSPVTVGRYLVALLLAAGASTVLLLRIRLLELRDELGGWHGPPPPLVLVWSRDDDKEEEKEREDMDASQRDDGEEQETHVDTHE